MGVLQGLPNPVILHHRNRYSEDGEKTELGFVVKRPYGGKTWWAKQRKVCPSFIISRGIDDSSNLGFQINDSTNRFSLFLRGHQIDAAHIHYYNWTGV